MQPWKKAALALAVAGVLSAQAQAAEAQEDKLPITAFNQADIEAMFERSGEPIQLASLSSKEMKETEGAWLPFAFYYYGPAIAGGVSWMATSGWRTIPGVWHNTRQRFSRWF